MRETKAIILVTYKGSPWISECLDSLQGVKYPILLCINPEGKSAYDMEAFYYAQEHGVEEFIVLHDSMVIKDQSFFEEAFGRPGHVKLTPMFLMGFGKFVLKGLPPLPPKPIGKKAAVSFETHYLRKLPASSEMFPKFRDTNNFVQKHGQKRMVLENDYLIKYKGTWDPNMVKEE